MRKNPEHAHIGIISIKGQHHTAISVAVVLLIATFSGAMLLLFNMPVIILAMIVALLNYFASELSVKRSRNAGKYSSLLFQEYFTTLRTGRQPHESFLQWVEADDRKVARMFKSIAHAISNGHDIDNVLSNELASISAFTPRPSYLGSEPHLGKFLQSELSLIESQSREQFQLRSSRSQIFIVFASFSLFIVPFSGLLVLILFHTKSLLLPSFLLIYPSFIRMILLMLKPQEAEILG